MLIEGSLESGLTWQVVHHDCCGQRRQEKSLIYGEGESSVPPAPFNCSKPPLPLPYLCPTVHAITFHFTRRWHETQREGKVSLAGGGIMSFLPIMVHVRNSSLPLLASMGISWVSAGLSWQPASHLATATWLASGLLVIP